MKFRAKVLLAGKTATGVEVPAKVVDGLGSTEMGHSAFHITHRTDTERYGRPKSWTASARPSGRSSK